MSIADKLMEIADKIPQIYNTGFQKGMKEAEAEGGDTAAAYNEGFAAGYEKGKAEGGDNQIYYLTYFNNIFGGATFPENYEGVFRFEKIKSDCSYLFNNASNLKSVKLISDNKISEAVNATSMFSLGYANTATLEIIDLTEFERKFSKINIIVQYQRVLKTIIGAFDLSECTLTSNAFRECNALEDIEFVANTIPLSIEFKQSPLLSDNSIQSIIDGLITITDGVARTLTLHATVKAKLTDEQIATITTTKGWTLA